MIEDPVVNDVHKARQGLLERHGGLEGVARYLREIEREMKERVVTHESRPALYPRKIS